MDCFYVSVERLLHPELEGKPVAVGGLPDSRGVVASASYEARAFGVRSAMPVGKALALCPRLILVQGRYSNYSVYTRQVEEILQSFTPLVEMASQDEAYLDLTGTEKLWGAPLVAAQRIREAITKGTRLPCSIGLGSSKLIAKVASGFSKPHGLFFVPHGSEARFLAPLNVRKLPGIGPQAAARLQEIGIRTLGSLAEQEPSRMESLFGKWGPEMSLRARGVHDAPVVPESLPKSISNETTFASDVTDRDLLHATLSALCEKVAWRMRDNGCHARTITLKYRYADFETHTAAESLPRATDDEVEIFHSAKRLLERHWKGKSLRLIGVAAGNLLFGRVQLDFFEQNDEKKGMLHEAIDRTRDKHGYGILRRGSSFSDEDA
jgi:DNA polymerase-4